MKGKNLTSLTSLLFFGGYIALAFFLNSRIIAILNNNLPFRQSYSPSIWGVFYVYVIPFLLGYFITGFFNKPGFIRKKIYFINISICCALLYEIPFIIFFSQFKSFWLNGVTATYSFIMFPFVFLLGSLPNMFEPSIPRSLSTPKPAFVKKDIIIALAIGLIAFALNFYSFYVAKSLVGADVYYHASMSQEILKGHSIFSSPYFFEGKNYYLSIVYYILAGIQKLHWWDAISIWMLYPAVCAGITFIFYYLYAKRILRSSLGAALASLLVMPSRQLTFTDPSVRNASYAFFAMFLFFFQLYLDKKKKSYLLISFVVFLLTLSTHPEVAVHMIGITMAYYFFLYFLNKKNTAVIVGIFHKLKRDGKRYIEALDSYKSFLILLSLSVLILCTNILWLMHYFSVSQILIFNEIPLSLFQPIGAISFLTFLLLPTGLYRFAKNHSNYLILAVASLGFTVIFYFSHLWILYHRYFPETAYFAFAIIAAYELNHILLKNKPRYYYYFLSLFIILLIISFYPKYTFTRQYSAKTNGDISSRATDFNLIQNNTTDDDVILIHPDDILNRYVPFYTGRYIFAGSNGISRESQWQVLSFCNGPFNSDCNPRNDLAYDFFEHPSKEKLKSMLASYKISYLLLNKGSSTETTNFQNSDLTIGSPIAQDKQYALYDIQSLIQ